MQNDLNPLQNEHKETQNHHSIVMMRQIMVENEGKDATGPQKRPKCPLRNTKWLQRVSKPPQKTCKITTKWVVFAFSWVSFPKCQSGGGPFYMSAFRGPLSHYLTILIEFHCLAFYFLSFQIAQFQMISVAFCMFKRGFYHCSSIAVAFVKTLSLSLNLIFTRLLSEGLESKEQTGFYWLES